MRLATAQDRLHGAGAEVIAISIDDEVRQAGMTQRWAMPMFRFVSDPGGTGRSLFRYCGLDWQDEYLDTERNTNAVTTASATQARRRIYTSSVGNWTNYEEQLQPLAARLGEAGVEVPGRTTGDA